MRFCPRCGRRRAASEPVCTRCGHKLYGLLAGDTVACASCEAPNPQTATYCVACGRPVDEPLSAPRAPSVLDDLTMGSLGPASSSPAAAADIEYGTAPLTALDSIATPRRTQGTGGCVVSVLGLTALLVIVALWLRNVEPRSRAFAALEASPTPTPERGAPATAGGSVRALVQGAVAAVTQGNASTGGAPQSATPVQQGAPGGSAAGGPEAGAARQGTGATGARSGLPAVEPRAERAAPPTVGPNTSGQRGVPTVEKGTAQRTAAPAGASPAEARTAAQTGATQNAAGRTATVGAGQNAAGQTTTPRTGEGGTAQAPAPGSAEGAVARTSALATGESAPRTGAAAAAGESAPRTGTPAATGSDTSARGASAESGSVAGEAPGAAVGTSAAPAPAVPGSGSTATGQGAPAGPSAGRTEGPSPARTPTPIVGPVATAARFQTAIAKEATIVPIGSGSMLLRLGSASVRPLPDAPDRALLTVVVIVDNVGNGPLPYDGANATLFEPSGAGYAPLPSDRRSFRSGFLAADQEMTGELQFEVPAGHTDFTLIYQGVTIDIGSRLPKS